MMALSTKRPSRSDVARERLMDRVTKGEEETRRLNVVINESVYRQIKMKAVEEGRSVSDITRDLWDEYLRK